MARSSEWWPVEIEFQLEVFHCLREDKSIQRTTTKLAFTENDDRMFSVDESNRDVINAS